MVLEARVRSVRLSSRQDGDSARTVGAGLRVKYSVYISIGGRYNGGMNDDRRGNNSSTCPCWYCSRGTDHDEVSGHREFYEISSKLLKAESLDPRDSIRRFACSTCGHITHKLPN